MKQITELWELNTSPSPSRLSKAVEKVIGGVFLGLDGGHFGRNAESFRRADSGDQLQNETNIKLPLM